MAEDKARILADGIEVWCAYDKLVKVDELIPHPKKSQYPPAKPDKDSGAKYPLPRLAAPDCGFKAFGLYCGWARQT